jgi:hypothetical protein
MEDEGGHPGRIYAGLNLAIWVLGLAILFLMVLNLPSEWAVRERAEEAEALGIAAENKDFCAKWGMPAESGRYLGCVRDLTAIRGRAELRLRDRTAPDSF